LANIGKVPELRRRILFTIGMLAVYRIGIFVTTPGVDRNVMQSIVADQSASFLGMFNMFSGGALEQLSIFALGIMPYVSASIILQLMTVVIKPLEELRKEGEAGQRKINQYTRYGTVVISIVQSTGLALYFEGLNGSTQYGDVVREPGWGFRLMTLVSLTTGTAFIMWLGEQISERGIGNGMSLIIFTGIVVGLPNAIGNIYQHVFTIHDWGAITLIILIAMMIAVVAFIVLVERGERRIPVQYAKRVVGRRVMGGQSTHMPLKVNAGGVIPVIFASSILAFPQTVAQFPWVKNVGWLSSMLKSIQHGEPLYYVLFVAGIIFFCFFYVSIIFNPNEAADNMRKYGGFIPGIRPGRNTADYMNNILTKITVVGGIYLSILCLIPDIMISGIKLNHLPLIGNWIDSMSFLRFIIDGLGVNFYFGGTSLLIVVGVAMDTINQIEAQLIMRHYEGFTPRSGRIRGRR